MKNLPINKGDPTLQVGDTGDAVKKLQQFLQTLPEVKKQQDFLKDFGQGFSFLDGKHYGTFEKDTRLYLSDFQKKNKKKIKKIGGYNDSQFDRILGRLDWVTWSIIAKQIVNESPTQKTPEKEEQKGKPPIIGAQSPKIADPPEAKKTKGGTHFVKTKDPKSRLALRLDAAYVKVSKDAAKDNDKKGKLVIMMPNDTILKVIDPHLGFECLWHQVEVVDTRSLYHEVREIQKTKRVYAFAEFVHPLDGTPKLLPTKCTCAAKSPIRDDKNRKTPFPDWTVLNECEPFYDEWTCSYYITVVTEFTSTDKNKLKTHKKIAVERGIRGLLEFYDRQRDDELIDDLIDSFQFAMVPKDGWFLGKRPNSKLKILVQVPAKYLEAVPEATDSLKDVAALGESLPGNWRTTHFLTNKFKTNLEIVAKRFEEYSVDIKDYKGKVNINIKEETRRLRRFVPVFDKFVKQNGFELREKEEDSVEIGFSGECFELIYVLINVKGKAVPLRVGLECFKRSDPVKYERTMGYIFYLEDMVQEIKTSKKRTWIEFFNDYSCPLPDIVPEAPPKLIQVTPGPGKTSREKQREDEEIHDITFKTDVLEKRLPELDFVGDPLLDCENIENLLDKITTIEDVYEEVLNKIDIKSIAKLVASCLAINIEPPDLKELGYEFVINNLPKEDIQRVMGYLPLEEATKIYNRTVELTERAKTIISDEETFKQALKEIAKEELHKAIDRFNPKLIKEFIEEFSKKKKLLESLKARFSKPPTISMPDNLFTEDILSNVGKALEDAIKSVLTSVLISMVKNVLRKFCSICNPDEDYGEENINDMLTDSGVDPDVVFSFLSDPDVAGMLKDLFDDLSALLLPSELCSLIEGNPSKEVIDIIMELINTKYAPLKEFLATEETIIQLFEKLGEFVDRRVCERISNKKEKVSDLCEPKKDFRVCLYKGRLDVGQIDELIFRAKEEDKRKIMSFFEVDSSISDLVKNSISCGPGAVQQEPESVDKLNNDVLDVIYDGVQSVFDADMMGYVAILTVLQESLENFDVSSEEFLKSHNAKIKPLNKDFNEEDTKALLRDPNSSGLADGDKRIVVAPKLRAVLGDAKNFLKSDRDLGEKEARYSFQVSSVNIESKIEKIKREFNSVIDQQKAAANKNKLDKEIEALAPTVRNLASRATKSTAEPEVCDNSELEISTAITSGDVINAARKLSESIIDRNSIMEYVQLQANELKDKYKVIANDPELMTSFVIESQDNVSLEIKNIIDKMDVNFIKDTTPQQDVFSKYVVDLWKPFVKEKKELNKDFANYFQTTAFHRINEFFIRQFSFQVSRSLLFDISNLNKIQFITDENIEQGTSETICPVATNESLMKVEEQKDKSRDRYESGVNSCISDVNEKSALVEEVNTGSMIELIIRLFVLENFLRSIFVFSEFKTEDIVADKTIIQFFVDRIKSSLRREGDEFFEGFMAQTKKFYDGRGEDNSLSDDGTLEDDRLDNDSDPENQDGDAALEQLIKETIKNVSSVIENLVGTNTKNIHKRFLDEWVLSPTELKPSAEFPDQERFFLTINDKKLFPFESYENGGLYLEKYIRVAVHDGNKVDRVESPEQFVIGEREFTNVKSPGKCGNFGIRLMYLPAPREKKFQDIMRKFSQSMSNTDLRRENAYFLEEGKINAFPLVVVEDTEEVDNSFSYDEDKIIARLKEEMIETDEYKLLFKYVFSMSKYLSLTTIYNILASGTVINGLDEVFANSKKHMRSLFRTLTTKEDWWKQEDPEIDGVGSNVGIRAEQMKTMTTSGPTGFKSLAAMTIPLLIKGLAENFDPSYRLIKELGLPLNWGSLPLVAPVNIFGPIPFGIGWGPPIGPYGAGALTVGLLPGEKKAAQEKEAEEMLDEDKKCSEEDKE